MQALGEKQGDEPGKGRVADRSIGRVRISAVSGVPRVTLALVGLLLIAFLMGWFAFNSRKHNGLARYKAELRARGEKLTVDELFPTDISESDPARTQLINIAAVLRQHSFSPGALDLMSYVRPGLAQVAWKQDAPPYIKGAGVGLPNTWEAFDAQLAPGRAALLELQQILTNPPAHWISRASIRKGPFPNFIPVRVGAQWLSGDAIGHLRHGETEEALRDIEAIAHFAQWNREDYTLVSQMIRVAVAGLGLATTWEALPGAGWTDEKLERLQRAWEPVDLIDAVEKGFVGERALREETWGRAHVMDGYRLRMTLTVTGPTNLNLVTFFGDYVQFPIYRVAYMDEDELFFLRSVQDSIERIRRVKAGQPWEDSADGLSGGNAALSNLDPIRGRFQHWISLIAMPNYTRAVQASAQNETLRQLTLAAIAGKRYQLRYGCLPPNPHVLTPEFLSRPTYDPMSGRQLQYTLLPDGRYILYSVGKDHRDDGGERPFWFKGRPGLWDDLDAVWPEPENVRVADVTR